MADGKSYLARDRQWIAPLVIVVMSKMLYVLGEEEINYIERESIRKSGTHVKFTAIAGRVIPRK